MVSISSTGLQVDSQSSPRACHFDVDVSQFVYSAIIFSRFFFFKENCFACVLSKRKNIQCVRGSQEPPILPSCLTLYYILRHSSCQVSLRPT